jgi:hypothetical protein
MAVFTYDCGRLLFLITLLMAYAAANQGAAGFFQGSGMIFPYVMYAAPNALFPLMSFFLLIRFTSSRTYIPLYLTGKGLSFFCTFLWLFFSLPRLREMPQLMLWPFALAAADLGTLVGMVLLQDAPEETPSSGDAENLPGDTAEPPALPAVKAAEGGG